MKEKVQKQERQRFFRKIRWFEEVIGEDLPVLIDKQIILNNTTAVLYIDNQEAKDDYLFSWK